jgi:hypothetical protein
MYQAPQQTRPARSGPTANQARSLRPRRRYHPSPARFLHSMRARFDQSRLDEKLASPVPPRSSPSLRKPRV